jgi:glycosyltransferase involved in cell wall biosynthesis
MEYTSDKDYLFTIQTQSLFDASTSKVPNFVYTDHTHLANLKYPGYSKDKLASANWIELERSIYQNAALIFTISENIRFSIVDQYTINPQKVKCVYAGCNIPVSPLNMSKSPKYSNKNILFVGLDWQRKGGPQLIQAFYKVLEKHPDATLTIVGASPRLNIPNCSVIGKVPLSEVAKYYEQASVFCLPTTLEPFGIVFLEAMTHKIPIVATNIGAIPEFIIDGESGYLIPPNNVKLLAERLIDLLDDPNKCQSFGDKGYKLASSKYSWENTSMLMYEHIMNYLRCNN